jgi:hypothetical protein
VVSNFFFSSVPSNYKHQRKKKGKAKLKAKKQKLFIKNGKKTGCNLSASAQARSCGKSHHKNGVPKIQESVKHNPNSRDCFLGFFARTPHHIAGHSPIPAPDVAQRHHAAQDHRPTFTFAGQKF